MPAESLIRKFHDLAGCDPETSLDADSLIGFFQMFRSDVTAIEGLYSELSVGDALHARLEQLYAAAGDDRRPQGGRDMYFVIRNPPPIDPQRADELSRSWLTGLRDLARSLDDAATADILDPIPRIRVLQGLPPKHPKADSEKSRLLRTLQQQASTLVEQIDAGPFAPILRPAYYFTACDKMLRDYLMWPLYAEASGLQDPLKPYFELWAHGVKYRIFGETQVDLYLPRQHA
jgi:hypothetical protein